MTLSSITELISIALFVPFISIILKNNDSQQSDTFLFINQSLDNTSLISLIVAIFIISGCIRVSTLVWQNKFASKTSNEIVYKAYDAILNESYTSHIKKPKSNLISVINLYGDRLFTEIINPILLFIEGIIFISLMSLSLFLYDWKIFLSILFLLFIIYKFFFKKASKFLKSSSLKQVELREKLLERLDTELNSIEYIHLGNYQRICSTNYSEYDKEYKNNLANYVITARLPKILIEYFILVLILIFFMFLYLGNNISNTLPLLASGALLSQKTFPYLQRIFENWSCISQFKYTALRILKYAKKYKNKHDYLTAKNYKKIDFNELSFKNVSFSYENKPKVINNIDFSIKKGEKVAIMGPSGTGKTTILRLICGLLSPSSGKVLINGKEINKKRNYEHTVSWMRSIGYVPQKINLTGKNLRRT